MDPIRLALLPLTVTVGAARAVVGLAEVIEAARPLARPDGPIRREDGLGERLELLLAPGGALEQLGQLSTLSVTLERLAELDETLRTLGQLEESLRTLSTLGDSLETLAGVADSLESLAKLGDALETLAALPERVISVEGQVVDVGKVLARLEPSLDALGTHVESLSSSLKPLMNVVERLPGGRRKQLPG